MANGGSGDAAQRLSELETEHEDLLVLLEELSTKRKAEDDAIAGFKAEIRGVKGALLSARNFPSSGRTPRMYGRLPRPN